MTIQNALQIKENEIIQLTDENEALHEEYEAICQAQAEKIAELYANLNEAVSQVVLKPHFVASPETLADPNRLVVFATNIYAEDREQAGAFFQLAAEKGSAEAMYRLGVTYPLTEEGARWLYRAATLGHTGAMIHIATHYFTRGNRKQMFYWLLQAAKAGDANAVSTLSTEVGFAFPRCDIWAKAGDLFRLGIEPPPQDYIAWQVQKLSGIVPEIQQDDRVALDFYEWGNGVRGSYRGGTLRCALMYFHGKGTPQNSNMAKELCEEILYNQFKLQVGRFEVHEDGIILHGDQEVRGDNGVLIPIPLTIQGNLTFHGRGLRIGHNASLTANNVTYVMDFKSGIDYPWNHNIYNLHIAPKLCNVSFTNLGINKSQDIQIIQMGQKYPQPATAATMTQTHCVGSILAGRVIWDGKVMFEQFSDGILNANSLTIRYSQ